MLRNATLLYTTLVLYLLMGSACADYPVLSRAASLDFLEISDPAGWTLRIDGDGGGQLHWKKLPGRRVMYLPATFQLQKVADWVVDCHQRSRITSSSCPRAVYYRQDNNETYVCYCPDRNWVKSYLDLAFTELRGSSGPKKDRRLLHRAWLSDPPVATLTP